MNYIYDIVLNFNKDYFKFFEWKKGDKIINVKKIPAFRVSSSDLNILKYNVVKIDEMFLDTINGATLFYSKMEYKYMCLVSDTNETIGLLFDKSGRLLKRSSLVFDEEEEVNEEVERDEEITINFIENKNKRVEYISRIEKEKRDYLFKFINNLDLEKDENILKYMYYDYFEVENTDAFEIKKIITKKIKDNDINYDKLYNLVKVLKKIKN